MELRGQPEGAPDNILRGQLSSEDVPEGGISVEHGAYQRIRNIPTGYDIEYGFTNFNSDFLAVKMKVNQEGLDATAKEFGYNQVELDALLKKYNQNWDDAVRRAQLMGRSQEELDGELKGLELDYKRRREEYLVSKGFKLVSDRKVEVDMPKLVRRNVSRLHKLAEVFGQIGTEKRYDSADLVGAVAAMVQTALFYQEPPVTEGSRNIGGLLPPLEALTRGWGDCDTKTGIMASVLMNWSDIKAIGVGLPAHYLMGIYRIPQKGDAYVEYGGLTYVLVEPVGPAWLPIGTVGSETLEALQSRDGVEIAPFLGNS